MGSKPNRNRAKPPIRRVGIDQLTRELQKAWDKSQKAGASVAGQLPRGTFTGRG